MLPSVGALFLLFLLRHSTVADEPVDAARKWLEGLQLPEGGWGRNTAKVVMAVALTDPPEVPSCSPDPGLLLSYHLLQEAWREGVDNIPRVRLAEYILALSSVCRNPLSFHGKNLIALLGDQPNQLNFQYAYTVLALCSTATSKYSHMYKLLFRLNEKQMSHTDTDTLAMAALSLQCIAKKHKFGLGKILSKIADDLESRQHPSGRFTNYHATILAVQALQALGARNWNKESGLKYLMSHLKEDGSFGNLFDTTQMLPLLANKTLADISMRSCYDGQHTREEPRHDRHEPPAEEDDGWEEHSAAPWLTFTLWQWVGLNVTAVYRQELSVPANTSLFGCLQLAAEQNPDFEFSVTVWPNGHYVYRIGDNGEHKVGYHFWLLYRLPAAPDPLNKPEKSFINPTGVDGLFPQDGDHILFWFKKI